ncbi:phosphoribosyltransferase family protein [Streptomyces sp. NPDC091219]|uniref:ComF family protein n=1 Tax=Streptomyces sp. NPDC091219 TaxID=3155193 RepID=UPI003450B0A4
MRGWWRDLTDLVLPAECGGCGRPRTVLCPECRAALTGAAPSRVRPMPEPSGLPATYATAPYADEVRAMLLAHKERGALALAGPLGAALAGAVRVGVREAGWEGWEGWGRGSPQSSAQRHPDLRPTHLRPTHPRPPAQAPLLLVPVPSARATVRARGHDPARRIALAAAGELRRTGTPARVAAVLRQGRWVADQAGLNSRQRLENLAGALEVVPGGGRLLAGGPVVLVDDLMTTGATLREAARAVREAIGCEREVGATAAVYARASREGREEHTERSMENRRNMALSATRFVGVNGPDDPVCAAVIAASPDSFEINRN